jgi:hypothetical protein
MNKTENVIDVTFNELTVRRFIKKPDTEKYKSWNTNIWVRCECSCGNEEVDVPLYGVTHGLIKSCGHLKAEKAAAQLEEVRKNNPTPTAIFLTHEGKTMNISEWSKETGVPRSTIMYRMNKGLPTDKILERKEDNEQNSKEN